MATQERQKNSETAPSKRLLSKSPEPCQTTRCGEAAQCLTDNRESKLEAEWKRLFEHLELSLESFIGRLFDLLVATQDCEENIVVMPAAIHKFFEETTVDDSICRFGDTVLDKVIRWPTVLKTPGPRNHMALLRAYYNLGYSPHWLFCEKSHCWGPGLTRSGFENFVIDVVRAYPAEGFARLEKAMFQYPGLLPKSTERSLRVTQSVELTGDLEIRISLESQFKDSVLPTIPRFRFTEH